MYAAARFALILLMFLGVAPGVWAAGRVPPPGESVDVDLASLESHIFDIQLTSGQFLAIRVSATGATVQATLTAPNGTTLDDRAISSKRPVRLAAIAKENGIHHLVLKTRGAAQCKLTVDTLRTASPLDAQRIEAQQMLDNAGRLRAKQPAESYRLCDDSIKLWREIVDV